MTNHNDHYFSSFPGNPRYIKVDVSPPGRHPASLGWMPWSLEAENLLYSQFHVLPDRDELVLFLKVSGVKKRKHHVPAKVEAHR